MKRIIVVTYIYSIASVILGPLIAIGGLGLTSGGGDCTDFVYGHTDANGSTISFEQRDVEFRNAQLLMSISGTLLGVIGAILLILLIRSSIKHRKDNGYIVPALLLLIMLLGYGLVVGIGITMECDPVNLI